MKIVVSADERVIVDVDGVPTRCLGPGRHSVTYWFKTVEVVRLSVTKQLPELRPEQVALIPETELKRVRVAPGQRAWLNARGRPVRWLGVVEHLVWIVDPSVSVELVETTGLMATPLDPMHRALVDPADYQEVTVPTGSIGARWIDGALESLLEPGRHAAWTTERKVSFTVLEVRERVLPVGGQELMTRDRVTLRLNVAVVFKVRDPLKVLGVARDADELLYLTTQVALRESVATRTLDELLADRVLLGGTVAEAIRSRAEQLGVEIIEVGVKDVVLPGEMRKLLNRVIEAQKEAEANVITRREETAAVRSMAQTAKVLAENPTLLRLKEIETYKDLAAKVGTVNVVLGDGALGRLELKTSA